MKKSLKTGHWYRVKYKGITPRPTDWEVIALRTKSGFVNNNIFNISSAFGEEWGGNILHVGYTVPDWMPFTVDEVTKESNPEYWL